MMLQGAIFINSALDFESAYLYFSQSSATARSCPALPLSRSPPSSLQPAELSIQHGAAGIIVSNHGARQLDYVNATIMALEEVGDRGRGG